MTNASSPGKNLLTSYNVIYLDTNGNKVLEHNRRLGPVTMCHSIQTIMTSFRESRTSKLLLTGPYPTHPRSISSASANKMEIHCGKQTVLKKLVCPQETSVTFINANLRNTLVKLSLYLRSTFSLVRFRFGFESLICKKNI